MKLLQQLLREDNHNSRFIYLVTNMAVVVCVIALVVATIWKGEPQNAQVLDAFIFLVGTLLSGGVAGAAGRWLTNKKALPIPQPLESTETKTTTVEEKTVSATKVKPGKS